MLYSSILGNYVIILLLCFWTFLLSFPRCGHNWINLILFTGCTKLHTKLNVMYQTVLWIPAQLEHCYSNSQGQAHQNLNTKEQMWTWAVVQPRWEICYPDNMQETDDVEFWDSISSLLFVSTQSSWSGSTGFRITSIETPVLYSVGHTLALIIAVIHHGSSALRELSHPCVKSKHACVPVHPRAVQTINITGVLLSHFS